MSAAMLLDGLEGVVRHGEGRWRARCPVCDSRRPVLAITETRDGIVLLRCFRNECNVADIVGAVGLDLSDLFPSRVEGVHAGKPVKRRFNAAQVLDAAMAEVIEIMLVVGATVRRGHCTPTEYARLKLSVARLSVAHGEMRRG